MQGQPNTERRLSQAGRDGLRAGPAAIVALFVCDPLRRGKTSFDLLRCCWRISDYDPIRCSSRHRTAAEVLDQGPLESAVA